MGNSGRLRLWAMIAPLLVIAVLGIRDFARAFLEQRKLGDAAFEATKWGRANGFDQDKIINVAQSATTLAGMTVSASRPCGCATSAGITRADCGSTCSQGVWPQPYIVVTTSMCYSPVLPWPRLSFCSGGNSQCSATGCTHRQVLLSSQSVTLQ